MIEALIISNILAWIVIVVLALLLFAITRQLGVLHERIAPAGALQPTSGPKVGELTKELKLSTIDGGSLTLGGENSQGLATFILFISPTCPVCKTLVPTAKSLIKSEHGRMQLAFASDGENIEQHQRYTKDLKIDNYPYVISEELGMTYEVSKLPFAVLIGSDGTLKSKGLVNSREHMESLIEAMDSGVDTLQEYFAEQTQTDNGQQHSHDENKASVVEYTS